MMKDHTVPCKEEAADDGECAEAVGERIDAREEPQVVGRSQPEPEEGQDRRDGNAGPGAPKRNEDHGEQREHQQENLCRPYRRVVRAEDAKELFDAEGKLHGAFRCPTRTIPLVVRAVGISAASGKGATPGTG